MPGVPAGLKLSQAPIEGRRNSRPRKVVALLAGDRRAIKDLEREACKQFLYFRSRKTAAGVHFHAFIASTRIHR